ncbi:MAG: response regulator [Planctomycetaceae bacterium]|nr:MAG: response regulator [Planctomycetaceae bacterium]
MAINVLVVDDSGVVRTMIIRTLKLAGVPLGEVYQAANGQEGLDALDKNWVDLVFADINMPVMNGQEMIGHIRKNPAWADLPIIVVSTEGSQTRIEQLEQKGATFIHKPFAPEMIRQIVQSVTGVQA